MGIKVSFLQQVSVLILTYNEEANIGRTLDALKDFTEVVLLDSGSTDATLEIAARYTNVRVNHRSFDNFSSQWNYGLTACGLEREWVLALDADYVLPVSFVAEVAQLQVCNNPLSGYRVGFKYCVFGKPLSSTLYPPLVLLYRRERVHYIQDGHCMRAQVSGPVGELQGRIQHDDRKSLARWLSSQASYAVQESRLIRSHAWSELKLQDKIRRLIFIAPWLVPLYCLTVGRGFLDGRAGLFYAMQRAVAESILAIQLLDSDLRGKQ
jgi:glycosyltransferase involved in cell wall biosynthesis